MRNPRFAIDVDRNGTHLYSLDLPAISAEQAHAQARQASLCGNTVRLFSPACPYRAVLIASYTCGQDEAAR